jgi:integrase/recombinase XerD
MFFVKSKNSIKLSEAGKLYLDYCELEKELRPSSIYEYDKVIRWTIYTLGDLVVGKISEEHITTLKKEYNRRELMPNTKALRLSVVREVLKFCRDRLHLIVMDGEKIQRPKIPRRRVEYLSEKELKRFFNSVGKENTRDLRFRAFLSILISTGCRISEALNLKITDIEWQKKEAMIVGKGNKQRKIYFNDWSLKCIRDYLNRRGYKYKYILIGERKNHLPWDRNDAARSFRRYRKRAGLAETVTAHTIRHSFATLLLKKNVSFGHIQVLLGHSDIQTTSRYYFGLLSDDEAKQAHEKGMNMDNWL